MGSQLADLQDCAHQSVHQWDSALEGLSRAPGFGNRPRPALVVASCCPPVRPMEKYCSTKNHLDQCHMIWCFFVFVAYFGTVHVARSLPKSCSSLRLWIVISLLRETLLTLLCGAQRDFLGRWAMSCWCTLGKYGQIWANMGKWYVVWGCRITTCCVLVRVCRPKTRPTKHSNILKEHNSNSAELCRTSSRRLRLLHPVANLMVARCCPWLGTAQVTSKDASKWRDFPDFTMVFIIVQASKRCYVLFELCHFMWPRLVPTSVAACCCYPPPVLWSRTQLGGLLDRWHHVGLLGVDHHLNPHRSLAGPSRWGPRWKYLKISLGFSAKTRATIGKMVPMLQKTDEIPKRLGPG